MSIIRDYKVGERMVIVKGRKYPIGTEFIITIVNFFRPANSYGWRDSYYLYGNTADGKKIKVSATNCVRAN